ncbi:uncharacterized protein LOC128228811 isoform X2 [Mya arenaria]|uniref:uncharacterized protein LOC128228811 isoform X2 n=1 Tax=Mya arenaria TaxID=6604 RepID=UPI0022E5EFA9|nr:uncharacterized protein LOC128228811 isoform X2 [Mya arenaria]
MISTKLFFDFSGKYKFQDKMRDLLNEIDRMYPDSLLKPIKEEKLRAVVAVDAVDAAAPNGEQWSPTKYASYRRPKPVIACDMTREFIDTWYKTHMLKGCIPATICADELRMLVDMRHEAPEFFYKCLCKMYKIRNPVKMSKVIKALRELYE